jgi:integrase
MRVVWFRGSFYGYWREGGKSRRTALRTQDRETAERRLRDLQLSLRKKAVLVSEMLDSYLADKADKASIVNLRFALKPIRPVFGHLRPDQIDRPLCRAYRAQRHRQGVKDGTVIKELSTLRAALRWHDRATPAILELPASPAPRSRHLSREEYRRLRDKSGSPHLRLFVILGYSTAGRASAILELTWDRVDFGAGVIRLGTGERRTKGRATVPMTDSAREALVEARRASLSNYVIEYAGQKVGSVKKAFQRAAIRAGVPWCSPHVLRHTAAVHMAESGVPLAEIAQYLGHTSESVTYRVYARFSPDYLRRAASALEG